MALPAGFSPPPMPPSGQEPMGSKAWLDYFTKLYQWQQKLLAALS